MSECVVRMERVPKNCDDGCWGSLSGECPWCDSIDGYKMVGNRPPNCPIITVLPEGHGDLVDRAEMLKKIADYHRYMTVGRESDPRCIIEDSPSIVPADTAERSET